MEVRQKSFTTGQNVKSSVNHQYNKVVQQQEHHYNQVTHLSTKQYYKNINL